jgi:hypothetical protein
MSGKTDSSVPHSRPKLDFLGQKGLELWLNYENKMDELRGRFLTIASILVAVQFGIFALMLDKIVLSESLPFLAFLGGILLLITLIITLVPLIGACRRYNYHIKTNFHRSCYVATDSAATDIQNLKTALGQHLRCKLRYKTQGRFKRIRKYLHCKLRYKPQEQKPQGVPKGILILSCLLVLSTLGIFVLGSYYNPNLRKGCGETKAFIWRKPYPPAFLERRSR